jgi:hypothetical protein
MGVTEWEFSMQTRIEKCRATISAINFNTEEIDKHPFLFNDEEIQYVKLQVETKLNPSKLEGAIMTAAYDDRKHQALVKQFYRHLKVWKLELLAIAEDGTDVIYVTQKNLHTQTNTLSLANS